MVNKFQNLSVDEIVERIYTSDHFFIDRRLFDSKELIFRNERTYSRSRVQVEAIHPEIIRHEVNIVSDLRDDAAKVALQELLGQPSNFGYTKPHQHLRFTYDYLNTDASPPLHEKTFLYLPRYDSGGAKSSRRDLGLE